MKDQKKRLNPYLLVILSFVIIILIGSVLLMFPFSRTANNYGNYIDCLFLATSATCVTGLNSFNQGLRETVLKVVSTKTLDFGAFLRILQIGAHCFRNKQNICKRDMAKCTKREMQ